MGVQDGFRNATIRLAEKGHDGSHDTLNIGIDTSRCGLVLVAFSEPTTYLSLLPNDARALAADIIEKADHADGGKGVA